MALKAKRDQCYVDLKDNELALLKFVGVKAYRDIWQREEKNYVKKYGEEFEEPLHQLCEYSAGCQTDFPSYNTIEIWRRVKDFITYKIDEQPKEELLIEHAYKDSSEKGVKKEEGK